MERYGHIVSFHLLDDFCDAKTSSFRVLASSVELYDFFTKCWFHIIVQDLETVLDFDIGCDEYMRQLRFGCLPSVRKGIP